LWTTWQVWEGFAKGRHICVYCRPRDGATNHGDQHGLIDDGLW
jgi:hypothetical protein